MHGAVSVKRRFLSFAKRQDPLVFQENHPLRRSLPRKLPVPALAFRHPGIPGATVGPLSHLHNALPLLFYDISHYITARSPFQIPFSLRKNPAVYPRGSSSPSPLSTPIRLLLCALFCPYHIDRYTTRNTHPAAITKYDHAR